MAMIEHGKVESGGIVFTEPLALPDGTEVVLHIEPRVDRQTVAHAGGEEFAALPFFGMWATREDMSDSAAWVREEREQWQYGQPLARVYPEQAGQRRRR